MTTFTNAVCDCCGKAVSGAKANRDYRLEKGWIEVNEGIDGDFVTWDFCPECATRAFEVTGRKQPVKELTCQIIDDPYRPIFKCCSNCYRHLEGNEKSCPSCQAKVV